MPSAPMGSLKGLAQALDVVGERWTLLLVRDSWLVRSGQGPSRGAPGIGTNLLARR